MGSQRAIGSLPVPWDRRHFLSSLTWKLYGASHLWLRPSLTSCLSSSHSRQLPALPAHPSPSVLLAPIGLLPKQTQRGHTAFCLTVPAPVSFAAPSGSILICFHAMGGEPHPWENIGAPRCWGHRGVPVPPHARCWSWGRAALLGMAGSEGCAGRGQGQRGDAQLHARGPAVPLPVPCSRSSPHGNELPFDCAFISSVFSFFFPLSEYTLCAVRPGSSLSCQLGSSRRAMDPRGGAGGSLHHPEGGFSKLQVVRGPGSYFGQG